MPLSNIADDELLRQHLDEQSGAAMAELVHRHTDLVHAAALRQVGPNDAADVTQAVFAILIIKAPTLRGRPTLGGWLLKTTRYCAIDLIRKTNCQTEHERSAATQRAEAQREIDDVEWAHLEPELDAALVRLAEPDRDAVVLRFFQNLSFPDIAQRLQTTEEAARKRVNRALEKLRQLLTTRGITIPAVAIGVGIGTHASVAAPASLVATIISQTRGQPLPASVASIVAGGIGLLAWTRFLFVTRVGAASLAGIVLLVALFQYLNAPARAAPSNIAQPPSVAPGAAGTQAVPVSFTVDQIIAAVAVAENQVRNVFVDGRVEEDTPAVPNDRNGGWNASPMGYVVRAWFDGRVNGPFRMEVAQHISQWTTGPSPYWETRYDAIYDGRNFSLITRAQGAMGQTRTAGPLLPGSPTSDLERAFGGFSLATGAAFTPNFWNGVSQQSLSAYLRARVTLQAARPDIPMSCDVRTESTTGAQIVCLTITDPVSEESWRFGPARGWAIVGFQFHRAMVIGGEKLPAIQMNIEELLPMPDGVWYPSRVQYIQQGGSDHAGNLRQSRYRYTAAQVTVNSPEVAARIPALP